MNGLQVVILSSRQPMHSELLILIFIVHPCILRPSREQLSQDHIERPTECKPQSEDFFRQAKFVTKEVSQIIRKGKTRLQYTPQVINRSCSSFNRINETKTSLEKLMFDSQLNSEKQNHNRKHFT